MGRVSRQAPQPRRRGFTLIELLTVIAIIAILASLTAAGLPRVLERAKIASVEATMRDMETQLAQYYADHSTYPMAYGFRTRSSLGFTDADIGSVTLPGGQALTDTLFYNLEPLSATLRIYGNEDYYDAFSEAWDTNRNNVLGLLEFIPIGSRSGQSGPVSFPSLIYRGGPLGGQVAEQLSLTEARPFVYIPVNMRQFRKAQQYWDAKGDTYATTWDPTETVPGLSLNPISTVKFPPPNYDGFALISVGPSASTFGVVPENIVGSGGFWTGDEYHILSLRAYYLASRDLDGNGLLDFDFRARTREGEAKNPANDLPDTANAKNAGPLIYVVGG